jgi:hypothetical protein
LRSIPTGNITERERNLHRQPNLIRRRHEIPPRVRDLPNALDARHQIPDEPSLIPHVPHLERALAPADNLGLVVLEAGDGAGVGGERLLALERLGVPDFNGRVGGGGDEMVGGGAEEADEGGVLDRGDRKRKKEQWWSALS